MAPYGSTNTTGRRFEGSSPVTKGKNGNLRNDDSEGSKGSDRQHSPLHQSHPPGSSTSPSEQGVRQSVLSPAEVTRDSDSPSVYDYFHLHVNDDDFEPNSPLILAHKRQNSGTLHSAPSMPSKASDSRNGSANTNLRLPPRPPSMIQTVLGEDATLNGTGPTDQPTHLSPSPLAFPHHQQPLHHFDYPHSTTSSHSSHQQQHQRPRRRHNTSTTLEEDEATPLFAKMQELQRREDPDYVSMTSNHSTAYTLCGFCCSWLVWVEVWICLFAAIIHRHDQDQMTAEEKATAHAAANIDPSLSAAMAASAATTTTTTVPTTGRPWSRLERIYFASSTFWTVGYGDYVVTTKQERLLTCAFLVCSLCFMGIALGRWGNSLIEAYKAASLVHSENKRYQQRRAQRQLEEDAEDDPMMAFLWNTHQSTSLQREHSMNTSRHTNASSTENQDFLIFPGLPWLFVQCLFLTALSIFCVFGIQYYEQDEESSDEWTAVSTLYFAISTATTTGFGDVVPKQRQGQLLAIFFLPLAVGTSLHWMVWMAQRGIQRIQRNMIHRRDLSDLRLDEFYERRLQSMGLVDAATFTNLKKEYEQLS